MGHVFVEVAVFVAAFVPVVFGVLVAHFADFGDFLEVGVHCLERGAGDRLGVFERFEEFGGVGGGLGPEDLRLFEVEREQGDFGNYVGGGDLAALGAAAHAVAEVGFGAFALLF